MTKAVPYRLPLNRSSHVRGKMSFSNSGILLDDLVEIASVPYIDPASKYLLTIQVSCIKSLIIRVVGVSSLQKNSEQRVWP